MDLILPNNPAHTLTLTKEQIQSLMKAEQNHPLVQETEKYDRDWLLEKCNSITQDHGEIELCTQIFSILRMNGSAEAELVDLLGFSSLDLISEIVIHKNEISYHLKTLDRQKSNKQKLEKKPTLAPQVTVSSQSDLQAQRQIRKDMRKIKAKGIRILIGGKGLEDEFASIESSVILGFNGDQLKKARRDELIKNSEAPLIANPREASEVLKYPHIYQSGSGTSILSVFGTKFSLPQGTERIDLKDYEEITIPCPKSAPIRTTENLIPIQEIPEMFRPVFDGYSNLNRIQSIVYQTVFNTNENILGKTDIAMLSVLHTISQYLQNTKISVNLFKIVYVCPMKALAAEIVCKFSKRLKGLGIKVRELTGDMQLSKQEIADTQMLVVTPEKWDIVTRKIGEGERDLVEKVHLLNEDRGPVIETLVARTLRLVESKQSMIRIVGLSATLPNYIDVATFLGVNPYQGLFYFDGGFRPVPLEQHLIGVKGKSGSTISKVKMNSICYEKVSQLVKDGHQVMVFVHSRKDTVNTCKSLLEESQSCNETAIFDCSQNEDFAQVQADLKKSKNRDLKELFEKGFAVHHAGMLRNDRNLAERIFSKGLVKVLCCTATLAWGVNLPAYAVVIKGTQVYNAEKGSFVDLSILDVLQIFGRAGRPQFEDRGCGYLLTSHDKLSHYTTAITQQFPIESQFEKYLADNLNAEISLGTIGNVSDAIIWISYTYLFVRMRKNPLLYGMNWDVAVLDPQLGQKRLQLITNAAKKLSQAQMIIFDEKSGRLLSTQIGKIASNYYINFNSMETFSTIMKPVMTEADILWMASMSSEFENIIIRPEEDRELTKLFKQCVCAVRGETDTNYGKANILLQSYISRLYIEEFALVSDTAYVAQNASRIIRALFEIAMSHNWGITASTILSLCKSVDKRLWSYENPLYQMDLPYDIADKISRLSDDMTIEALKKLTPEEIGLKVRYPRMGSIIYNYANQFPVIKIEAKALPVTSTVLRVTLKLKTHFKWTDSIHGVSESFWVWVTDDNYDILHIDYVQIRKACQDDTKVLQFTIPAPHVIIDDEGRSAGIYIKATSDRWIGSEAMVTVSLESIQLPNVPENPNDTLGNTELDLSMLEDPVIEDWFSRNLKRFGKLESRYFHSIYRTRANVLIAAPFGMFRWVASHLALCASFSDPFKSKFVYVTPRENNCTVRMREWKDLATLYSRRMVKLTGNLEKDFGIFQNSDIIISSPKDLERVIRGCSVQTITTLFVEDIDYASENGIDISLEVLISRILASSVQKPRIIALSSILENTRDMMNWLQIEPDHFFSFNQSINPVEIHIEGGYMERSYNSRMSSMNKPIYEAIAKHSPSKPVIIFVSSKNQVISTGRELVSLCQGAENRSFLKLEPSDIELLTRDETDEILKLSLQFGIGTYCSSLTNRSRKLVEELFCSGNIQILITTFSTELQQAMNANLVIIKGTETFDVETKEYFEIPGSELQRMVGVSQARTQTADCDRDPVVVLQTQKVDYYRKFMHEPYPIESNLHSDLQKWCCNGENEAMSDSEKRLFLKCTLLFQRLKSNPSFYGQVHLGGYID